MNTKLTSPRIAVITPYYKEPIEMLRRCHDSVMDQTVNCDHLMIADGFASEEVSKWSVKHIQLPEANADNGNTPRGLGSLLALAQGYDFIAYLDADNWYTPDHLKSCLDAMSKSGAGIACTLRTYYDMDGNPLAVTEADEDQGRHVDASCFVIARKHIPLMDVWLKMPKPLSPIGDRIIYFMIKQLDLKICHTGKRTVAFRSRYKFHYAQAGLAVPEWAKDDVISPAIAWLRTVSGVRETVQSLGFYPA